MANIYDGNNKKYEALHIKRVNAIEAKIKAFFKRATDKASLLASKAGKPGAEPFSFKDHPDLEKQADEIARELAGSVRTTLLDGVRTEWSLANEKNDELARLVFGDQTVQAMTPDIHARYFGKNEDALEAFAARKTAGLNLSDRVWKYTFGFKNEIEMALDIGIREGKSAAEISRDLRGYLQHPDKLFRRVRDEHGILHLSKAAKDYHPGIGVYRSSYMNARRLAVTETNMAYRAADHVRQQQLDFVVGIRIKLSNNHNCKGVPAGMFVDICDTLQGDYPKDFIFTGWHPHCRCHTEPILKTPEELKKDTDRILQGKKPTGTSVNRVKDMPDNFLKWVEDNKDKIAAGEKTGKLPYFLRDNHKMLGIKPKTTKAKVVMKEALAFNFEEPAIPAPAPTKPQTIVQEFIKEPSNYPDETKYKKIYDAIEHWKEGQNESPILLELIENSTFDGELARGMTMTQKEYRDFTDALIKKKGNAAKAIFKKGSITSWTKDESIAREFYAPSTGDDSIRIVMKVKGKMKGYDLDKGALWGNEDHEVILSQKIKLKYVSRMQKHDELGDYVEIILKPTDIAEAKTAAIPTKLTPKDIAAKRHAARTSEQAAKIQKAWDDRKAKYAAIEKEAEEMGTLFFGAHSEDLRIAMSKYDLKTAKLEIDKLQQLKNELTGLKWLDNPINALNKGIRKDVIIETNGEIQSRVTDWLKAQGYKSYSNAPADKILEFLENELSTSIPEGKYNYKTFAKKNIEKLKSVAANKLDIKESKDKLKQIAGTIAGITKKTNDAKLIKELNKHWQKLNEAINKEDGITAKKTIAKIEQALNKGKKAEPIGTTKIKTPNSKAVVIPNKNGIKDFYKVGKKIGYERHPTEATDFVLEHTNILRDSIDAFAKTEAASAFTEKELQMIASCQTQNKLDLEISKLRMTHWKNTDQIRELQKVTEDVKKECAMQARAVENFTNEWDYEIRQTQMGNKVASHYNHEMSDIKERAESVERFIESAPKWEGAETYRGMSFSEREVDDFVRDLKSGKADMRGTSSWSTDESIAVDFAEEHLGDLDKNSNEKTMRVILVAKKHKKATPIMHFSKYAHEREVLSSRHERWHFVQMEEKDGCIYITVEPA